MAQELSQNSITRPKKPHNLYIKKTSLCLYGAVIFLVNCCSKLERPAINYIDITPVIFISARVYI